ncbi:UspA domain protein [Solidesulfovibrio fructosivorans JJ]]|uniref:UspA domain protein n=1 Tax=Solidesulfovibrio fructosivorans JJ] TaxID=596151 RepID=E1JW87_SOLFR|nr:universal stress protein [Solidesulfovibrio fructosivorans]EFL51447.1 UspA domain protein [Solidesulfovibrio fructosivorans JJ]]
MFKDIVLAVTPSAICENAAEKAFSFAKLFDAKLYLAHVCGLEQGWGEIEYLESSGATARIKENIEAYYKDRIAGVPHCEIIVRAGIPHNEVLRLARQKNADLIIMGPHTKEYTEKRSRMWGMAGSTLERVSQRASCPVMIVTNQAPAAQRFGHLIAATDFSDQAECAVSYAGQMARHYRASLTVFHVLDKGDLDTAALQAAQADTVARLREIYEPRLAGIANHDFQCLVGDPAMEILGMSQRTETDLIIMAHHSKEKDPEQAFLGSTVTKVALNAACPTMSVNKHFDLRCGLMYDQTGQAVSAEATA